MWDISPLCFYDIAYFAAVQRIAQETFLIFTIFVYGESLTPLCLSKGVLRKWGRGQGQGGGKLFKFYKKRSASKLLVKYSKR